jgi:hypothetical protein
MVKDSYRMSAAVGNPTDVLASAVCALVDRMLLLLHLLLS